MSKPVVSVIVPMYNEEEVIRESYRRLHGVMEKLELPYEVVFVNDGSRDKTFEIMQELRRSDPNTKLINFARNFGHQIAVSAGLDYVTGDAIVIIDADLQDPPELIPDMLALWREGWEVVYGKRKQRKGDSVFKRFTAFAFYRTLNWLSGWKIPNDTGDFRLIDRKVADAIRAMPEQNRFLRGMVSWVGFKQTPLEFLREERWAGTTKYPLKKMIKLAADGIISFSIKPLQLMTKCGLLFGFAGFVYALIALIVHWSGGSVGSWHYLLAALFFCTGLIVFCLGITGEYIGRIYDNVKGRPLYLVSTTEGFEAD